MLMGKSQQKFRQNPRKTWYDQVNDVTTNGDYEASFNLKRLQPSLLALLASGDTPVYPCHVSPAEMRTHPIGTGPFKFVEFKANESIKLALGEASRLQSLFAEVGFVDIETHTEKHTFVLPSFDAYYGPFERGGASTGQALAALPSETRSAVREEVRRYLGDNGGPIELETEYRIASGRR